MAKDHMDICQKAADDVRQGIREACRGGWIAVGEPELEVSFTDSDRRLEVKVTACFGSSHDGGRECCFCGSPVDENGDCRKLSTNVSFLTPLGVKLRDEEGR